MKTKFFKEGQNIESEQGRALNFFSGNSKTPSVEALSANIIDFSDGTTRNVIETYNLGIVPEIGTPEFKLILNTVIGLMEDHEPTEIWGIESTQPHSHPAVNENTPWAKFITELRIELFYRKLTTEGENELNRKWTRKEGNLTNRSRR